MAKNGENKEEEGGLYMIECFYLVWAFNDFLRGWDEWGKWYSGWLWEYCRC